MRKFLRHIATLCILLLPLTSAAASVEIEAKLDTTAMMIGEQQNLSLSIGYNPARTLILPDLTKQLANNIITAGTFTYDTAKTRSADEVSLMALIPFTCFDAGEYSFVVGPFIYDNDTLWSEPLSLSVATVELDSTATLQPIKPIQVPQYSFKDYLPKIALTLGILLALALLGYILWRVYKKRKDTIPFLPKKQTEHADVKALRDLEELKSQNLCEKDEYKAFYTELTTILRAYFGEVLSIDSLEKTTDELLQEISLSGKVPLSVIQNLQMILKEGDFVKFAKHKPTIETGNLHYGLAVFCINESKHLIHNEPETEQK